MAADFDGDPAGLDRMERASSICVAALGAGRVDVGLGDFLRAGDLLYEGTFVAERFEAVGEFVMSHRDEVDPVVGSIIASAAELPAWKTFADRTELARLAMRTAPVWDDIDMLVVPSVPRIPTVDEVQADPIAVNTMLGRFTNFVNMLDLCAVTVPVEVATPSRPPASVTLIAPAWADDVIVAAGRAITASFDRSTPGRPASLRGL